MAALKRPGFSPTICKRRYVPFRLGPDPETRLRKMPIHPWKKNIMADVTRTCYKDKMLYVISTKASEKVQDVTGGVTWDLLTSCI